MANPMRIKRFFCIAAGILFTAALIFALFLPFPAASSVSDERYLCLWEDGSRTQERYYSAYAALKGVSDGSILLSRDGMTGTIEAGDSFREAVSVANGGTLAELLAFRAGTLSSLEQSALCRILEGRIWYAEGVFVWDGERVRSANAQKADEVVLLSGAFETGFLANSEAEALHVCAEGEPNADDLSLSSVTSLTTEAPWYSENDALYTAAAGALRLVAVLPDVTDAVISENARFCEQGALLPCRNLQSVSLPFLGSAKSTYFSSYDPFFGYLFADEDGNYRFPASLRRIRVTGGKIAAHAFYRTEGIEELDLCGIPAKDIEKDAFAELTSLNRLHTKKRLRLDGFSSVRESCGCYLYTKDRLTEQETKE